ncbi:MULTISPECIES: ATP-binding protein [unclassified Marinomonas]|uniref:ATP-binding protein n=1 Tax=unclassified Marinomonas TaxID=196814 RepID=UPI0007AF7346|nr:MULTISPECIES: ATP-binding protein [unclassified Marinomonas]
MLKNFTFQEKNYQLLPNDVSSIDNLFTIIVGENGSGKSRLLKKIIEDCICSKNNLEPIIAGKLALLFKLNFYGEKLPQNIISASMSPFDRFPLNESKNNDYHYLGLRKLFNISSDGNGLGHIYMESLYSSLLKSAINNKSICINITKALDVIGFERKINAIFEFSHSFINYEKKSLSSNATENFIYEYLRPILKQKYKQNTYFFHEELFDNYENEYDVYNFERIKHFLDFVELILLNYSGGKFDISLSDKGVRSDSYFNVSDYLDLILNCGIISLKEIKLTKKNKMEPFLIGEASSGEQSVILSILGIASKICESSMIFIDEPEVCLHPKWQERYIELLMKTFEEYKNCHFIIATHSPLMISKLRDRNCFVMSMSDRKLHPSTDYNKRSVDFQLANVFKTPGFKNEFLTRTIIKLLTSFGSSGNLNQDQIIDAKGILDLKGVILENDPVYDLMIMLEEVLSKVEEAAK